MAIDLEAYYAWQVELAKWQKQHEAYLAQLLHRWPPDVPLTLESGPGVERRVSSRL
jgi:hypothetical protein